MELCGPGPVDAAAQPQCVSRSKLNLRRRIRDHMNPAAAAATIKSAVSSCQSMLVDDKPPSRVRQRGICGEFPAALRLAKRRGLLRWRA